VVDWMQDRVGAAERSENPMVLTRMRSGFAVMGDYQFLPGYCLLLASPQADHLSDLPPARRAEYLFDMSVLGEAVIAVCMPRRVNYEILGNSDPFLHAHVWPRYEWEPQQYHGGPVWRYPHEHRYAAEHKYAEDRHGTLRVQLLATLTSLMADRGISPLQPPVTL
jgi:diadenosine tetraphosphate (Ap4A) HIT family hydrolase